MSTSEFLTVLLPHLAGLRIDRVFVKGRSVRIQAATQCAESACPGCQFVSRRVHSRYERRISDPSIGGQDTTIHLRVRRFFCDSTGCEKKTFAEQVQGLTFRHGRQSVPLREAMRVIALALGGRAGARLTRQLAIWVSRMTLLRLIRGLPEPAAPNPQVLGVDDFALRRGHNYGTILIDLDTHRPIDVLPDREADSFAAWLEAHPGVAVICRDRAGCYADGAERGAPTAMQVADRWHLLHNLTGAVERAVARHRRCLRPETEPPEPTADAARTGAETWTEGEMGNEDETETLDSVEGPRAARTRARHAEIHALVAKGLTPGAIARTLCLDRKTVRRYAVAATADELIGANPTGRTSMLNPHKRYLRQRWAEGCTSTSRLYEEIRERGFRGSMRTLRRWLIRLRAAITEPDQPPATKPRQIIGWIISRPEKLTDDDHARLDEICARCDELAATRDLARGFAQLLRERRGADLEVWVKEAENGPVQELRGFASGLRKDWDAVTAGLTLAHSSGPVEGHVNRIKMLKRQMYGRANPDLLRKRVLLAN